MGWRRSRFLPKEHFIQGSFFVQNPWKSLKFGRKMARNAMEQNVWQITSAKVTACFSHQGNCTLSIRVSVTSSSFFWASCQETSWPTTTVCDGQAVAAAHRSLHLQETNYCMVNGVVEIHEFREEQSEKIHFTYRSYLERRLLLERSLKFHQQQHASSRRTRLGGSTRFCPLVQKSKHGNTRKSLLLFKTWREWK